MDRHCGWPHLASAWMLALGEALFIMKQPTLFFLRRGHVTKNENKNAEYSRLQLRFWAQKLCFRKGPDPTLK